MGPLSWTGVPVLSLTCYVLNTGDGYSAVFVNALAAPGEFLGLLVPFFIPVNVDEVRAPLIGHSRGRLHALLLLRHSRLSIKICLQASAGLIQRKREFKIVVSIKVIHNDLEGPSGPRASSLTPLL